MPLLSTLLAALAVLAASSPAPPAAPPLPTVDPHARQVLADMVNAYGFGLEEYTDIETIQATGDLKSVVPEYINSHFTVVLNKGFGLVLTGTYSSGAKVTVHAFQQHPSQGDTPFLVITTDSRSPGLYIKDVVPDYDEAREHAFSRVGLGTVGAGALFSESNIGSLLLHPAFEGLAQGPAAVVDGVTCESVVLSLGDNFNGISTFTCYIGQKDHLLRRLLNVNAVGGQTMTVSENLTHIRSRSFGAYPFMLSPSLFRYAPPHSARQVKFFPPTTVTSH